jgi:hypothetical protein
MNLKGRLDKIEELERELVSKFAQIVSLGASMIFT